MRNYRFLLCALGLLTSLAMVSTACGDDDGSTEPPIKKGIYELTHHFANEDGCEELETSDHESLTERYFFVGDSFFGLQSAISCDSPEQCKERYKELKSDDEGGGFVSSEYGFSNGVTGYFSSGGGDTCTGSATSETIVETEGGAIRGERREYPFENVPRDAEGFCDDDAVDAVRTADNCKRLEVYTGTYLEAL